MSSDRGPISSGKQEGHRHVRIHPECTLCGSYFDVGAPMVSCKPSLDVLMLLRLTNAVSKVLGDRFNATCRVIESSTFPIAIYCNQRNGTPWTFCQFPKCAKCAVEQESVTVHRDCFQIFLQETSNHPNVTAYNLWHATHARYPWRGFWPLPLTTLDENAASVAMAHAAANWRLPLDLLPNELLLLICENLRDSVFWRYILVKEFVRSLIANAEDSLTTAVELSQVQSWRRGESPKIGQSSKRSYIRLTMDSFGIYEIERLPHMPQKSALRSETHAYVVDSARQLGRISMTFKVRTILLNSSCQQERYSNDAAVWSCSSLPTQRHTRIAMLGYARSADVTWRRVFTRHVAINLLAPRHNRNRAVIWNHFLYILWPDCGHPCAHYTGAFGVPMLPEN